MSKWKVDAVAFTGHKALLGPTGIGGLILSPGWILNLPDLAEQALNHGALFIHRQSLID